ncbi:hypothetical protein SeGA_0099, partial [Salmonella enterica subsp. enterica serovar Gaminara str. A4-567]
MLLIPLLHRQHVFQHHAGGYRRANNTRHVRA